MLIFRAVLKAFYQSLKLGKLRHLGVKDSGKIKSKYGFDHNINYFISIVLQAKEKKNRMKKVRGTKKAKVGAAGKKVRQRNISF